MGGEEFAIVLPQTGRAAAMAVAEKLRAAIASQTISAPGFSLIGVTASIGIASLERTAIDLDTLLQRSDEALYKAKAGGRNRCVEWNQPAIELSDVPRRVLKAGRISFNAGRSTADCTVRTLVRAGRRHRRC
jgi:predicted signal transduction protein with EAL and GGDEF domain